MLESHAAAAVDSVYLAKEKVPIYRLDSIASNYLTGKENLLIKIDTQGFEWQVLDGAKETLQFARGVLCELSLVPLYEGRVFSKSVVNCKMIFSKPSSTQRSRLFFVILD